MRFVSFATNILNENSIATNLFKEKSKNVSFFKWNKIVCELYKFCLNLALHCKNEKPFDAFEGKIRLDSIATANDYRFTICLKNDMSPYYFSKWLTLVLVTQTIPIYLGTREIGKFSILMILSK